jgi:uncharacterized protein YgbK (DUF1537 family)
MTSATRSLREATRRTLRSDDVRIAVIDDDPTGIQTLRGVPLISAWEPADVDWAIAAADPVFAVLTNSRALSRDEAVRRNTVIGQRLASAAQRQGVRLQCISRSDSTLRGHFPDEVQALAAGLAAEDAGVATVVLCPAFPEAGRITIDDIHWVVTPEGLRPVGETEFARDEAFGYQSSDLKAWIRERAGAHVSVASLSLDMLRCGTAGAAETLIDAADRRVDYVVANAADSDDLDVLAAAVRRASEAGRSILVRSGPSFVAAAAGRAPASPLGAIGQRAGRRLVVVGSHTALTTRQLAVARERHDWTEVTLDVGALVAGGRAAAVEIVRAGLELGIGLRSGDAALVTSRDLVAMSGTDGNRRIAGIVADALVQLVGDLSPNIELGCLIAKGGITSHDLAVRALGARRATVLGQLFPGQVSVWELGDGSARPGLLYVVFPGNVGGDEALAGAIDRIKELAWA